jgi:hypothetical protein
MKGINFLPDIIFIHLRSELVQIPLCANKMFALPSVCMIPYRTCQDVVVRCVRMLWRKRSGVLIKHIYTPKHNTQHLSIYFYI